MTRSNSTPIRVKYRDKSIRDYTSISDASKAEHLSDSAIHAHLNNRAPDRMGRMWFRMRKEEI